MKSNIYEESIEHFQDKPIVTIAAGTTCAYLGDERNLREFLVADETARQLRQAGHVVISLLFDDSFDALTERQLRVALNKDIALIQRHNEWCGKPIGSLPDPFGCHSSFSDHFESKLLDRLRRFGCQPNIVSTYSLYTKGFYQPFIEDILTRYDDVLTFLKNKFPDYTPDKLFWVLCPKCGYLDSTSIINISGKEVNFSCTRCDNVQSVVIREAQGKFNWKLDCALRWALFKVDAEPFNTAYLEPIAGSFAVAQSLSREFFGGAGVFPIQYGMVKMDRTLSFKLMESVPPKSLRELLVEHPGSDIAITSELMLTSMSRHFVMPDISYLDYIKQLLPVWLLTPESLTLEQRELVSSGIAFSNHFFNEDVTLHVPSQNDLKDEAPEIILAVSNLVASCIAVRQSDEFSEEEKTEELKRLVAAIVEQKKKVYTRLRILVGQDHGLPVSRILEILPLQYLRLVSTILNLTIAAADLQPASQKQPVAA